MEFVWEKFLAAYQEADKGTKELIDSGIITDFVQNEVTNNSLSSENRQIVVVALSHYVLKATPENELVEILVTHGVKNVSRMLNDFNSSYKKSIPLTPATPPPDSSLVSEISETELALEKMHGLRTMAQDVKEAESHKSQTGEMVYQSTQTDILRPGPKERASAPQWETDN